MAGGFVRGGESGEGASLRILLLCKIAPAGMRYGTELVAEDLAQIWSDMGCTVFRSGTAIAGLDIAPWSEGAVNVLPLAPLPALSRRESFEQRSREVPGLAEAIAVSRPDIAVVVGFGPGMIDLRHFEILGAQRVPIVLWHHVPSVTCQQHGLRYKSRVACDGTVIPRRCAACRLAAVGVPDFVAESASWFRIPGLEDILPRGLNHLVGARDLSERFALSVAALRDRLAHSFVGADFVHSVLECNGFARDRISRVRPGLREDMAKAIPLSGARSQAASGPLRAAFWGRLDGTKGVDTAIRAVRRLPDADIRFQIAGVDANGSGYGAFLETLAHGDPRITFLGRLDAAALTRMLADSDVAIIPSTWLETGPLTVFEAHAAGLPILGSAVGGIGEICRDDPSARLFPRDDDAALAALLHDLVGDPSELARRRALVPPARTMRDAAGEMLPVMRAIVAGRRVRPGPID